MKKNVLILIIMLIADASATYAQKVLTLGECYDRAMVSTALAGEKDSYSSIYALKDKNLSKGWLPTLDAGGNFIYNSSVADVKSAFGSLLPPALADAIKPLPHEQYKITMDINQVFYDGGAIRNARALEKADLRINEKQTEADLYRIRSQVNGYYFNIILLARQKELLGNYLEVLNKRLKSMQSASENGIIIKSDIDVLLSERIKLGQQLKENEIRKASLLRILSGLTGTEIDESTEFIVPVSDSNLSEELLRPELQIFDLRKEQLDAGLKALESRRMPKAFGFATLGYGNPPGSNFFKDEFAPYYILGAGVKWNIFDWNKVKNEKQVILLQKEIIENRKSDLSDNLKRLLDAKDAEISSLKSLVGSDSELIALRKRITASAESQYENGVITATELLNEMNSERQALINFEIHKLNLAMAQIEYMNISGKEIE
jgi:outer membrane protein TolC